MFHERHFGRKTAVEQLSGALCLSPAATLRLNATNRKSPPTTPSLGPASYKTFFSLQSKHCLTRFSHDNHTR
jgi:hypothetical protein